MLYQSIYYSFLGAYVTSCRPLTDFIIKVCVASKSWDSIRNENKHLSFGAIQFRSRQMVKCRFLSLIFQIFWGSLAVWERLRGLTTIIFGCQRRVHEPSTGANTLNQPIRDQVDLVSGTYLAPHSTAQDTAQFVNRPCQATSCAFLPWQW